MDKIEITALTDEQRTAMAKAAQPAFEEYVTKNLDAGAQELLKMLKGEVNEANATTYLD